MSPAVRMVPRRPATEVGFKGGDDDHCSAGAPHSSKCLQRLRDQRACARGFEYDRLSCGGAWRCRLSNHQPFQPRLLLQHVQVQSYTVYFVLACITVGRVANSYHTVSRSGAKFSSQIFRCCGQTIAQGPVFVEQKHICSFLPSVVLTPHTLN